MAFLGSSPIGVSSENPTFRARPVRAASRYWAMPLVFAHGRIAPWRIERSGLARTRSGSGSRRVPSPVQVGQAPCGELKENVRGSTSPIEKSPWGQANLCENKVSDFGLVGASSARHFPSASALLGLLASAGATSTRPSPRRRAVSTESVRRGRSSSAWARAGTTNRSTTTSTVCFFILSSWMSSERSRTVPSTRTRAKPARRAVAMSCWCSPFRSRTSGARTSSREPSGCSLIRSTISCGVCATMGMPWVGQCGTPTRANSRRRWS